MTGNPKVRRAVKLALLLGGPAALLANSPALAQDQNAEEKQMEEVVVTGFRAALSTHAIALVPAQSNPFTRCKTNNRLATAFVNGLAVAADALPAYEEFADVAVIDDWDSGLGALMDDADGRAQRVRRARERLQQRYSLEGVCQRWLDLTGRLLEAQTRELPRKELV